MATLCGCGQQAAAQLRALRTVLPLRKIYAFDLDAATVQDFAENLREELEIEIEPVVDLALAVRNRFNFAA